MKIAGKFAHELFVKAEINSCDFSEKLLPKRLFDVDVYPYGKYAEENDEEASLQELRSFQNLTDDIINKINEMHLVATRNRFTFKLVVKIKSKIVYSLKDQLKFYNPNFPTSKE